MQQDLLAQNLGGILYKLTGEQLTRSQIQMLIYVLSTKPDEYEQIIQQLFQLNESNLDRFREMITKSVEEQQHFEHHENVLIFKNNVGYDYTVNTIYLSHDDQIICIQKAIQCGPILKIVQDNRQLIITYASELSVKIARLYFEQVYKTLTIEVQKPKESQIKPQPKQEEISNAQPQRQPMQQQHQQITVSTEQFSGDQQNCICAYSLNKKNNAIQALQSIISNLKIETSQILNVYCLKNQKQNVLIEFKKETDCKYYKQSYSNTFKTKAFQFRITREILGQYYKLYHWEDYLNVEQQSDDNYESYDQWSNESYNSTSM